MKKASWILFALAALLGESSEAYARIGSSQFFTCAVFRQDFGWKVIDKFRLPDGPLLKGEIEYSQVLPIITLTGEIRDVSVKVQAKLVSESVHTSADISWMAIELTSPDTGKVYRSERSQFSPPSFSALYLLVNVWSDFSAVVLHREGDEPLGKAEGAQPMAQLFCTALPH